MAEPLVRTRVRLAFRALAVARGVECFLIGSGTLLGLLAIMAWERAPLGSFAAWITAAGCGVLAAATWWFEHSPRPAGVARRLDRRMGMDGMLFTAWEVERSTDGLGVLLSKRVAARVPRRRALDAVLPASAPLLVLPFLGAGMLAFALDVRGTEEDPTQRLLDLTRAAQGHIADAGSEEELSPEALAGLRALDAASGALLAQLETDSPTSSAPVFEDLLGEIERLRGEVPAGEEASRALDHAEELFEAARLALGEGAQEPQGEGSGLDASVEDGLEGGHAGARGGTMSGLDPRAETPTTGDPESGWEGPEGALGPGTHWPEEHRGVVRRWVELARTQARERDE